MGERNYSSIYCNLFERSLSTALRKIVAFLMQGDALALSVDALALSVNALVLSNHNIILTFLGDVYNERAFTGRFLEVPGIMLNCPDII
ncbi:hypothetical protein LC613_26565 [Nostoc sphaeroides CHAB 2801]|uniref:hypothetical protein n=1 Tax=Nostoc sphaeroides TaxID=446679 RepID=UPI00126A4571|nr:hypothetical protein [Nostoc sphaeroides]MCC5631326.1 hypothetical protein [Nostoc sphaeroides CHAB 2801]